MGEYIYIIVFDNGDMKWLRNPAWRLVERGGDYEDYDTAEELPNWAVEKLASMMVVYGGDSAGNYEYIFAPHATVDDIYKPNNPFNYNGPEFVSHWGIRRQIRYMVKKDE